MAFPGRAIRPPFENDSQAVAQELIRMVDGGAKRFYIGHGRPLRATEVSLHAKRLSQTASQGCRHGHRKQVGLN